jgi:cytochrome oxidase Cu insertion factor (SCO1/SenC/PrrC family)
MRILLLAFTLLGAGLTHAQDKPKQVLAEKGKKAPDFMVKDAKGKPFKLSEFMKKGDKNVVLIFSRGGF